jgi:acyl-CoA synthetase (AMP-forming)/AMP-acid ligase II
MRVGDRFLHVAPLYHAAELDIMLIPGTMIGAKHVILPRFDPATVLGTLESERITMFFGVPTMYRFLLRLPDLADRDLSCWRTGLFGAALCPRARSNGCHRLPVYSVEVEGALAAHPDVADVAVVGRPHPDYGESIVAVITPRDGVTITLDDVRAFLRDHLTGYKIPHDVIMGAIPRNRSGKVLKHKLREAVAQQQATAS